MLPTETKNRIPRNLLTIINNIPVINNCQQVLAAKTPNCAQLAMISHPGLSFDASCTQFGLITKFYMDLLLALRAMEFMDRFVNKYEGDDILIF
jgi:hypothetical protein